VSPRRQTKVSLAQPPGAQSARRDHWFADGNADQPL